MRTPEQTRPIARMLLPAFLFALLFVALLFGGAQANTGSQGAAQTEGAFAPALLQIDGIEQWLARLRPWWNERAEWQQWALALIAVALLLLLWQRLIGSVLSLIWAVFLAAVVYAILDATRATWQPLWDQTVGIQNPDPALIGASIPLVGWVLALVRRGIPRG